MKSGTRGRQGGTRRVLSRRVKTIQQPIQKETIAWGGAGFCAATRSPSCPNTRFAEGALLGRLRRSRRGAGRRGRFQRAFAAATGKQHGHPTRATAIRPRYPEITIFPSTQAIIPRRAWRKNGAILNAASGPASFATSPTSRRTWPTPCHQNWSGSPPSARPTARQRPPW